jgi:hypothetical protein
VKKLFKVFCYLRGGTEENCGKPKTKVTLWAKMDIIWFGRHLLMFRRNLLYLPSGYEFEAADFT